MEYLAEGPKGSIYQDVRLRVVSVPLNSLQGDLKVVVQVVTQGAADVLSPITWETMSPEDFDAYIQESARQGWTLTPTLRRVRRPERKCASPSGRCPPIQRAERDGHHLVLEYSA